MVRCSLDADGRERLVLVIRLWRDDDYKLDRAIYQALEGVKDPSRRTYLRGELERRARQRMRAQNKKPSVLFRRLMNDPEVCAGARKHETRLTSRIPERDR